MARIAVHWWGFADRNRHVCESAVSFTFSDRQRRNIRLRLSSDDPPLPGNFVPPVSACQRIIVVPAAKLDVCVRNPSPLTYHQILYADRRQPTIITCRADKNHSGPSEITGRRNGTRPGFSVGYGPGPRMGYVLFFRDAAKPSRRSFRPSTLFCVFFTRVLRRQTGREGFGEHVCVGGPI